MIGVSSAVPGEESGSAPLTLWQIASRRLRAARGNGAVWLELLAVAGLLALLFAVPALSWWQRWNLPDSPQGYGMFLVPLIGAWLWFQRRRLALPELDALNARFTERSVLRFLLEETPEPPTRVRWPLILACLVTPLALWTGEAMFTYPAFVLLLAGLIGYRFGTAALRMAALPLVLLTLMTPLSGLVLDTPARVLQTFLLKIVAHLLDIVGVASELGPDANPIFIPPLDAKFLLYAAQIGTGFAQGILYLLGLTVFLSLIDAPLRAKILAVFLGFLWIGVVMVLRLVIIGAIGGADKEWAFLLAGPTRWLLPVVGALGQTLILKGLRCQRYHAWVTR